MHKIADFEDENRVRQLRRTDTTAHRSRNIAQPHVADPRVVCGDTALRIPAAQHVADPPLGEGREMGGMRMVHGDEVARRRAGREHR